MIHPDRLRWLGVLLGVRHRPAVPGPLAPRSALVLLLAAFPLAHPARSAEVQLQCQGTLLEARGSAERKRPLARIAFSLNLEAEAPTADGALARLQARLAAVRSALRGLGV
ncbi:MAG: SIMPL domain-containing protein, partial [Cyanobium sp.]